MRGSRAERDGALPGQLALETYKLIPTRQLVEVVRRTENPWVGVCLDAANCLASLESPLDVAAAVAPAVSAVHVKDFAYERRDGGAGFQVSGRPLGHGQLDYRAVLDAFGPQCYSISLILEHWLPWQGSDKATCDTEAEGTEHGVRVLLDYQSARSAETNC